MTIDTGTASAIVIILGGLASAVGYIIAAVTKAKLQIIAAGDARAVINQQRFNSIEEKVNGSASVSAARIDSLHEEVADAKSMIADLHQTAAVLAAREGH